MVTDVLWALVLCIVLTPILTFAIRKLTNRHVDEGHNDTLVPIFLTAGTIYAVFLAFIIVAVWTDYGAARDNIADEASSLGTIYRASMALDPASGNALRESVRAYTEAVIDEEWRIQAATGGASPKARIEGLNMYRLFGTDAFRKEGQQAVTQTILTLVTQVQQDRNRRTLQASEAVDSVIWWAVLGGAVLVILMSMVPYMETAWLQLVMCTGLTILIGSLLAMTAVLSHPFKGPLALQPEAFEHSLKSVYPSVDKSPPYAY